MSYLFFFYCSNNCKKNISGKKEILPWSTEEAKAQEAVKREARLEIFFLNEKKRRKNLKILQVNCTCNISKRMDKEKEASE